MWPTNIKAKEMKRLTILFLVVLVMGCTNQETSQEKNKPQAAPPKEEIPFPTEFLGAYISTDYLEELEKHGSTKKAQEQARMSTATLYQDGEDIILANTWNFHEGGGADFVKMISATKAIVIGELSKDTIYSINFSKSGAIQVNDEKDVFRLTQFSNDTEKSDYSPLVNTRILPGKLSLNNSPIQFKPSGAIVGLDSIVGYSFNEDYYDAGMQFDMIYLRYADDRPEATFGYIMEDKTFLIFELNCKVYDKEHDLCVVTERGNDYLTFSRED